MRTEWQFGTPRVAERAVVAQLTPVRQFPFQAPTPPQPLPAPQRSTRGWLGPPPGHLQINDLLFKVPPESIHISQNFQNLELPILRRDESLTLKSGHGECYVSFPLLFVDTNQWPAYEQINMLLAPLLQQLMKTPFVVIENELLRHTLFPGTIDPATGRRLPHAPNMAFSLANITISTLADHPGALEATANFILFNYFPFSRAFTFRGDWETSKMEAVENRAEAFWAVQRWQQGNREVYDPRESQAWKAFWQHGWETPKRLLQGDLKNDFALEFTLLTREGDNAPTPYRITWSPKRLIPVQATVTISQSVARLPLLNWVYAVHQDLGNREVRMQVVFQGEEEDRLEIEQLQTLILSEQAQTARFRYLSKYWGIKIHNDLARLCHLDYVTIDNVSIDTIPGHPNLLQVILNLSCHNFPEQQDEQVRLVNLHSSSDQLLQQALDRILSLAEENDYIVVRHQAPHYRPPDRYPYWQLQNLTSHLTHAPDPWTPSQGELAKDPVYQALIRGVGPYNDNLLDLLNRRPDRRRLDVVLPDRDLPDNHPEREYYQRLRALLRSLLQEVLKNDPRFADLRHALFIQDGNHPTNICYPDLQLPPHPATGRVSDTEPDCYFFNESDSRPTDRSLVVQHCLEVAQNAYTSVTRVLQGTGGLDFQFISRPATSGTITPLKPQGLALQEEIERAIADAVKRFPNLSSDWLRAIIAQESSGRPDAVSSKGAMGLMQIMPATAQDIAKALGVTPEQILTDPYWNIMGGAYYLDYLLQRNHGVLERALAAYLVGPGRISGMATDEVMAIPGVKKYVDNVLMSGTESPWINPVSGTVTSTFRDLRSNDTRFHAGVDIAAPAGTPVVAPTTLNITFSGYTNSGGYMVFGTDSQGYIHQFAHLQGQPPVRVGQTVAQGSLIGYVGSTGSYSTGPHLDWKVKVPAHRKDEGIYNGKNGYYRDVAQIMGYEKGDKVVQGEAGKGKANRRVPYHLAQRQLRPKATPVTSSGDDNPDSGFNSTERSFDGWQHPPEKPGSNSNLRSQQLSLKRMGFLPSGDVSYQKEIIKDLDGKTLAPLNQHTQDVGPGGAQEILQLFASQQRDCTLTMRRAYPTFALYFRDESAIGGIIPTLFFSNAYSWGSVKELRLIRSRKNPIDTLIIQLSNVKGDLFTQQFNTLNRQNDEMAISFNRQVLKEGTGVELRLGYHNDPEKLDVVFTGKITEIEGHNSAVVTVICQSYAVELFQTELGDDPTASIGWFHDDTKEIISTLLLLPEVVHFGRYQSDQTVLASEGGMYSGHGQGIWSWLPWRKFFRFFPNPADNNLNVPEEPWGQALGHAWRTSWFDVIAWLKYVPYHQTAWEIIEEMTLRHPGYVAAVLPYRGVGHHWATLFFGIPAQPYYFRTFTSEEAAGVDFIERWNPWARLSEQTEAARRARMRPFRNYFYFDSEHHIIHNGIVTSARDTYNAVSIEYVYNATQAYGDQKRPDPSNFFTDNTLLMKANDAIRPDYCRWFHTRERNCEGARWATSYALGYMIRHLKDLYNGEIIVLGEPTIKPYDIAYIFDSYNDMAGPIEVEQVVHVMSQETGFVSIITPDLVVQGNEYLSASLATALMQYFTSIWLDNQFRHLSLAFQPDPLLDYLWRGNSLSKVPETARIQAKALTAAATALAIYPKIRAGFAGVPMSIIMASATIMLFNWARKSNPVRITPLIWKGRPLLCGLDGFTLDTSWGHAYNGLVRAFRGIDDFMRQSAEGIQLLARRTLQGLQNLSDLFQP